MTIHSLRINAWSPGLRSVGPLSSDWVNWATEERMQRVVPTLAFTDAPDRRNWRHPKVGWGVLLPENDSLSEKDRALPCECPPGVQKVVRERNGVTLRYRSDLMPEKISRYYIDHQKQDLPLIGTESGIGVGELPMYLLILASPQQISWKHQYVIGGSRFVGRLDLPPDALVNYFEHLSTEWKDSSSRALSPLLWAVDWGPEDITSLMRQVLADPVYTEYCTDDTLSPVYLRDADATCSALTQALSDKRPAMIVTTSHGRTGPLDDIVALRASVGVPVDQRQKTLDVAALLRDWQPDGAIWYAHACCSAGTDAETSYAGLFEANKDVDRILQGVAKVGSQVAALPIALLSASKPARAFVGHVEPTFDWPLQDPETGHPLSGAFCDALTTKVYGKYRHPIGSAFKGVHSQASEQFQIWYQVVKEAKEALDPVARWYKREMALRAQLGGLDWQSVVIIGDPTVAIPMA